MGNKIIKFTRIASVALTILASSCSIKVTKNYTAGCSARECKKPATEKTTNNFQSPETVKRSL